MVQQRVLEKSQDEGFVIENGIIKGREEHFDIQENNLGEFILNTLNKAPDCIGQIDAQTGKKRTYAEMRERSIHLARWLKKEGIEAGDVVSICSPRHPDIEIIFYATSFVGAIYSPFTYIVDLTRHCINTVQSKIIFTHKNMIETLEKCAAAENHSWKIVVIDSDNDSDYTSLDDIFKTSLSEEIENFQSTKVDPDSICVIMPTSGTTGMPKFIPLSHKQFIYQVFQFDIIGKSDNYTDNVLLTYFYPGWLVQMLASTRYLLNRQTLVFHNDFEPHETCKIIEKYKINALAWDVYMISLLAESDAIKTYNLASVKFVHSVGSKLFNEVREKALKAFPNVHSIGRGLGIIETGLLTLFTEKCRNPHSEGQVVPNVHLKIVDVKTGIALGANDTGELCAKSPCMMTSYFKNPRLTKATFDDKGWYHTGDEAYYDDNGEIIVTGRLRETIKYQKVILKPLCIEQKLLSHPSIIDTAVVGIYHNVDIEQPIAFLKIAPGSKVTEKEVLELTRGLEGCDDVLKNRIIFTDEIPRNNNGKINRRLLRERAENYYKSKC